MSKSRNDKPKKCIKQKLEEATELYEEIKKEAEVVRQILSKEEVDDAPRDAVKRKARLGRN